MLDIQKIHEAIDAYSLTQPAEDYHVVITEKGKRNYLGMSGVGDECARYVWYNWRKCFKKNFPARLLRLFRRGDREEFVFVNLLKGIGCEVFSVDGNGKQFKVSDFDGHLSGHIDGVVKLPKKYWLKGGVPKPLLAEYKTYNESRFKELKKRGVKTSDPKYYSQMQLYMGYNDLTGALFCAVNKNDDSLHFEYVAFRKPSYDAQVSRAEDTLTATAPPPRLSNTPSFYKCKFCDAASLCHKGTPALKNCYSCKFSEPAENATWICAKGHTFGETCEDYSDITK